MAKKYVDAVLLRDELRELYNWSTCDGEYNGALEDVFDILYNIPSADVQEVKHGQWKEEDGIYVCSKCGYSFEHEGYMQFFNFCPNCGARMDGEENGSDMQDITKVVRCKDCKFRGSCYCTYNHMFRDNDYCSYGKRKDGEK